MLKLEIITPEKIAYTDDVDMVMVPSAWGRVGILPRHIPLFAQLVEGELKIKKGSEDIYLSIGGGFVEVTKTKVVVLVTRATHYKELNETEIAKAKLQASEALKNKPSGQDLRVAQALLRQSIVDLRILTRRKNKIH